MKFTKEISDTLSPDQLALLGKQRKVWQKHTEIRRLNWEIAQLQAKLTKCAHQMTEPYKWEWDSGYGNQRIVHGKRCTLCGSQDPYDNGRWLKD